MPNTPPSPTSTLVPETETQVAQVRASNDDEGDRRIKSITVLFEQAERDLKRVENLRDAVVIPAVNELRYAGYHIVRSLRAGPADRLEQLARAERHCRRAVYDALDAGIVHCLNKVEAFREAYKSLPIVSIFPAYADIRRACMPAQEIVSQARLDVESRQDHCERARAALDDLLPRLVEMDDWRDDLNAQLDLRRAEQQRLQEDRRRAEAAEARAEKAEADKALADAKAARATRWAIGIAVGSLLFTAIGAIAAVIAIL